MRVRAGAIDIEYETLGSTADPPLVLIMGFGQQLIAWDKRFCEMLTARGFQVVIFDNRDVGLSTKIDSAPPIVWPAIFAGDMSSVPYTIDDMADDTAALIEALGLGSAHVAGVSMGGMIAQALAIRHPDRVRSLASIMSSTGDRQVGQARPEVLALMMQRGPTEREAALDHGMLLWRTLRSPGFPVDDSAQRARVARAFDRSFHPPGVVRQTAAIASRSDRTEALRALRLPTVVVHGTDDPLIHVSGGEATARAISGAKLVLVPGMGHDLPEGAWSAVVDAIVDNARRQG